MYLIDVTHGNCWEVDVGKGFTGRPNGGDHSGLGKVLGGLVDEDGRHPHGSHDNHHPDKFPGGSAAARDVIPPVQTGLLAVLPEQTLASALGCCRHWQLVELGVTFVIGDVVCGTVVGCFWAFAPRASLHSVRASAVSNHPTRGKIRLDA